jgi:hypothetical protein
LSNAQDHFVRQFANPPEYLQAAVQFHLSSTCSKKLSDHDFQAAKEMVMTYLACHNSITNRELRALTQLNYDQAVSFFNKMIADGYFMRVGKTTSTKYVLRAFRD